MKTVEEAIAFNQAYRLRWRDYFERAGAAGIQTRLSDLVHGLDLESRQICENQVRLAPYFFPDPLLDHLQMGHDVRRRLLPPKTQRALEKVGFFGNEASRLAEVQEELRLPVEPLPEFILDAGLKYVPEFAKTHVRGRVVIDGGAFIGDTAKLFVAKCGAERVHAFEPRADSYSQMVELVDEWGLSGAIVPHKLALSERPETTDIWGDGVGASPIRKHGHGANVREEVRTTSVDVFVREHAIRDVGFIKLDVEGAELAAVRGAVDTITRCKPLMIISIYHTADDFFEIKPFLDSLSLGYRFLVRKLTDDLFKELVLICLPDGAA